MKSRFHVQITVDVLIDIEDDILNLHADQQWVDDFYGLDTPEKVAEHLAWNVGLRDALLDHLDGFADRHQSDVTATIDGVEYDTQRLGAPA